MCICAYIQAHTYVYPSVHVCALHIHMYVCMHMCVCVRTLFFKLTTQTTVRISILKKRKKNTMRRHKNDLCMTMEAFGQARLDAASPVTGHTRVNLNPQRSVSRSC